ncbi:hypothetical protein [Cohnella sp. WQ 127256]|uniref:hypothetical protein n=1 Tax=Cohnella sp. WQ 127256 TaxID=2938790 RepID=UPI00211742B9|nr:hypothetical protein [Cohnella sp. WQ 127256]
MENKEVEELLARRLTEELSEPSADTEAEAEAEAVKQLSPRWEIRIQAKLDPVVEETKAYRAIAQEVHHRYEGVRVEDDVKTKKDEG